MSRGIIDAPPEVAAEEWVSFPGGELEGKRPRAMCPACRDALKREAQASRRGSSGLRPPRPLCFQCYRAELDRQRAIGAAAELDTGSAARFQAQLPFEPVNRARLDSLKAARAVARADAQISPGHQYADKRRQAQIAARHTLQHLADGLKARALAPAAVARAMDAAIHAAELQLPDAWLPFVVSR